ncbi:hypothetical protein K7X08_022036 [Anisodus acutangulus]|uniref:Uncharacterized protein n=1 Tax=Anisodus acutangulus TaxID=402998 RepID=A0A9Q1QTX5_9SOLA|nr:hypothetical protein K7X08_022036 [Anisodus acutangulus]
MAQVGKSAERFPEYVQDTQDAHVNKTQGGQINHDQLCDYLHDQQLQPQDGAQLEGKIVTLSLSSRAQAPNHGMHK